MKTEEPAPRREDIRVLEELRTAKAVSNGRTGVALRLDDLGIWQTECWPQMAMDVLMAISSTLLIGLLLALLKHRAFVGLPGGVTWTSLSSLLRHAWTYSRVTLGSLAVVVVLTIWSCERYGLYRDAMQCRLRTQAVLVSKAVLSATLFVAFLVWLTCGDLKCIALLSAVGVANIVVFTSWRAVDRRLLERRACTGYGLRNVVIIGVNQIGRELAQFFESNKHLGYRVMGFLDDSPADDIRWLGPVEGLRDAAWAEFVDEVFVTSRFDEGVLTKITLEAQANHFDVRVIPHVCERRTKIQYMGDFPVLALYEEPIPALALPMKRALDLIVSALGLVILSPFLLLVAVVIKLDSSGPVLYRSPRVGKKGRQFIFYKFRTMVSGAEQLKDQLREMNERQGLLFKVRNDPRVTKPGRLLRKYSIDELPQLWNVLRGDMSLVGPRPPSVDEYQHYDLRHLRRLAVKPGMTGNWQVYGREDPSFERALILDEEYINNWSSLLDLKLILKTIPTVIKGTGQ